MPSLHQLQKEESNDLIARKIITKDQQFWLRDEVTSCLGIASYSILLVLTIIVGRLSHQKVIQEKLKDFLTVCLCVIWMLLLTVSGIRLHVALNK
jgi:hypothetical protein